MKTEELLKKAESELINEREEAIVGKIKESLSNIKSLEKTLTKAKTAHQTLLDTEVELVELEDLEY